MQNNLSMEQKLGVDSLKRIKGATQKPRNLRKNIARKTWWKGKPVQLKQDLKPRGPTTRSKDYMTCNVAECQGKLTQGRTESEKP
jgi:hypothetical protein